ncbi:hypothetical protein V8F06_011513, partial [Rhypophila decipiens]
ADSRYSYFVGVLESVRDSLKPLMEAGVFNMDELKKATAAVSGDATATKDSSDMFKNMFGILGVYEPSDAFLNAPDVVVPKMSPEDGPQYVSEQVDGWEDFVFVYTAFLSDLSRLRDEIRSMWTEWKEGSLDLTAVAVATNMAFQVAHAMEDEMAPLLKKQSGRRSALTRYYEAVCPQFDVSPDSRAHVQFCGKVSEISENILLAPCFTVSEFKKEAKKRYTTDKGNVWPHYYQGKHGWYIDFQGPSASFDERQWRQTKTGILQLLPNLDSIRRTRVPLLRGELTRDLDEVMNNEAGEVPLWFAWALQLYLDILQRVGKNPGRYLAQFNDGICQMQRSVVQGVPSSCKGWESVVELLMQWDEDPIRDARNEVKGLGVNTTDQKWNFEPAENQFLYRNSIYCGLQLLYARVTFQGTGVQFAAPPGVVLYTMQLYHALRQEKLIPEDREWRDLEIFREMHGDATFFVGDPPTTVDGYYNDYKLSIGTSIANWAPNKRSAGVITNTGNHPNMKFPAPLSALMYKHLTEWAPGSTGSKYGPPLSAEAVERILEEARDAARRDGKGHLRADRKGKDGENRKKSAAAEPVATTPAGVIRQLALAITAEVPKLTFDHFAMHNFCWDFLDELRDKFSKVLKREMDHNLLPYLHDSVRNNSESPMEYDLTFLVGYTFLTAANTRRDLPVKFHVEKRMALMEAAAEVMNDVLQPGDLSSSIISIRAETRVTWPMSISPREQREYQHQLREKYAMKKGTGMDCPVQ